MHDRALHGEIDLNGDVIEDYGQVTDSKSPSWDELCPRCHDAVRLHWVHGSWQCSECKFKEGCCG